jgi:histidinol-phosphate aminotransferase
VRRSVESNKAGLAQLAAGMKKLGVRFIPSVANFTFVEFDFEAEGLTEELLKRGVIVRPMRWMGFPNAIRVSVGTEAENEKFLAALAGVHGSSACTPEAQLKGKRG